MQASGQIFRKIFRMDNTRRVRLTYYVYHSTAVLGLLWCLRFRLESARCDCTSSENPTSLFHHTIAAAVWLSDEHYFEKKIARLRTAAARPPYEIMKPFGSYIAVDQFFDRSTFGSKKAARQTYNDFSRWHPGRTCQLINSVMGGPCSSYTIA